MQNGEGITGISCAGQKLKTSHLWDIVLEDMYTLTSGTDIGAGSHTTTHSAASHTTTL